MTGLPVIQSGWDCHADRGVDIQSDLPSLFPKTDPDDLTIVRQMVDDGYKILVGLSGGKDSISCCLLLMELGIPFKAVFADTGWEAAVTYNYVAWFCHTFNIELVKVQSQRYTDLMDLIRRRACFPKMKRRFCTEEMKEIPISAFIEGSSDKLISVAGIRAAESKQRAKMQGWVDYDTRFKCPVWHPIFTWTYDDVIAMHHRAYCKPNPLYLLGAERVGCFPCVFGKKAELRIMSLIEPHRIATLRGVEQSVDRATRESKGDAYEERNYPTSTMFWMSINGQGRPALIDDVIARAWKPSDRHEKLLLKDGLASQALAAQKRWGWVLQLDGVDLYEHFVEGPDAIHADYAHRYKTTKELRAVVTE